MEHAGQLDVGGVLGLAACALVPVLPRRRPPDRVSGAGRPLLQRVLVDDDPLLGVAALDLLLGLDQSRHVSTASSIFGYAPQRQRFPAIPWRTSSDVGVGLAATSAVADTIWPGVQKPH